MYYVLRDQVFASHITKNLLGGTNSFEVSSYNQPLFEWLKICSGHAVSPDSEISSYFVPFLVGPSLCFTDQETQEDNLLGWKQLPFGHVLSLYSHLLFNGSIGCMYKVQVP